MDGTLGSCDALLLRPTERKLVMLRKLGDVLARGCAFELGSNAMGSPLA